MAQLCLKWNNYEASIIQIFQEMYESENLVDVTIACERQFVKAHKIVLAACSPYFQSLFMANPCKHPIVILKDVRFQDLKSLVEFMYRGEVTVSHEQLPSLLKTAETLQIKQLAEMTTRPATYESASQVFRGKKRKKAKAKRTSSASGTTGNNIEGVGSQEEVEDEDGVDRTETKMMLVQDHNGQQFLAATGPDGQPIHLDGGDGSSRILELSMAEVVGTGNTSGHETGETVTADIEGVTGDEDDDGQDTDEGTSGIQLGNLSSLFSTSQEDSAIMLIRKKQSFVWEYFTETGKGSVKCRKCGKLLSYKDTSGSTSNMIKHLKTVHSVERANKPALQE